MASTQLYEEFSLTLAPNRDEIVVVPRGELDIIAKGRLEREVADLVGRGFERVVIDLRGVTFLDSAGLHALLGLRNEADRNGHDLFLVAGCAGVQRLFEVTGTRRHFTWREPHHLARST